MKTRLYIVALGLLLGAETTFATDFEARMIALKARSNASLDSFERRMAGAAPDPEVRALADYAWTTLALDRDPAQAEKWLRQVFATQNMDEKSPDFGNVPWQVGHPEMQDPNSIEFTMSSVGAALCRYRDRLSDDFRSMMIPHLKAAVVALRRHDVPVAYTNIYLMKLGNLMMLGQLVADSTAVTEGAADMEKWLAFTRENGLTEYDSPTYSRVQMTDLELAYLHAPNDSVKGRVKLALDYLWSDIAANYFDGTGNLSGPRSRSYDFVYQNGTLHNHYYAAGLTLEMRDRDFAANLYQNLVAGGYRPSSEIIDLAKIPERVVRTQFGPDSGKDRYNYITPDFTIGSASAYYCPYDTKLCVEVASTKKLPTTWVVADQFDAPYGMVKMPAGGGHVKPRHLKEKIAAVQEKGTILALQEISVEATRNEQSSVATNVILPWAADAIYFNGKRINEGNAPCKLTASSGSVVGFREGKAGVAVRIFAASGADSQQAEWQVKYDGNEWGAGRLVAYHYQGDKKRLPRGAIRSGVLLHVERCEDDAALQAMLDRVAKWPITEKVEGTRWHATLEADYIQLQAGLDLTSGEILARRMNGQEMPRVRFSVNERDLSSELLGNLGVAPKTTIP